MLRSVAIAAHQLRCSSRARSAASAAGRDTRIAAVGNTSKLVANHIPGARRLHNAPSQDPETSVAKPPLPSGMDPTTTNTVPWASGVTADTQTLPSANTIQTDHTRDPSFIVIFGWLGAKMPTLRKYADAYRRLYPSSAQIIISSDPVRFWKPLRSRLALGPVVRDVEAVLSASSNAPAPRILLHVMSNGGVCSLVDLASVIRKRRLQAPAGTKCALVFDSCPAPIRYGMMIRAFTAGFRNRLTKALMAIFLSVVYVGTFVARTMFRFPNSMERELVLLNDPALLPWTSVETPRMYLYSSGDRIVHASAVEEHAAKARMVGFPVRMVHFGQSGHVAHAREDPEKYWGAIRTFWEEAHR
ncbi:hypothetical protein BV20DRAFT_211301 [Pilatotrama ljubarskyi]|nr:hypothetical protein BV20DRAFT_211301 [Pilatotrama ljubarskyi]